MTLQSEPRTPVFEIVTALLAPLVGDLDVLDIRITRDTRFHDDLQLESIDLVTFSSLLAEHFGPDVSADLRPGDGRCAASPTSRPPRLTCPSTPPCCLPAARSTAAGSRRGYCRHGCGL